MTLIALTLVAIFLAYANGANDNFKGVATLYGSGVATYWQALTLATVATLAGSAVSLWLAAELVKAFSGKGLVPDSLTATPSFLLAVALGASLTVMAATRLAFPISTTHALLGALMGAGWMAVGSQIDVTVLGKGFAVPLLTSPLIALALSFAANALWQRFSARAAVQPEDCLCVLAPNQSVGLGAGRAGAALLHPLAAQATGQALPTMHVVVDRAAACDVRMAKPGEPGGERLIQRVTARGGLTFWHGLSATTLCFARGLNDTPKIVGLMVVIQAFSVRVSMVLVALAMAAGGLLHARRVAETMSHKITAMSEGAAGVSNSVTSLVVIAASLLGLPVSTTHVSVGAISGMGLVRGSLDVRALRSIVASWFMTLPLAALVAACAWWLMAGIPSPATIASF